MRFLTKFKNDLPCIFYIKEMSSYLGADYMIELGISFIESSIGDIDDDLRNKLYPIFEQYLQFPNNFHFYSEEITKLTGKNDSIQKLKAVLDLPETPLPDTDFSDDELGKNLSNSSQRRKTRTWTNLEDQRLLAGVAHFGVENWQSVSRFLGSGRNRAQCSQRWTRCLNPRISKKPWTNEDDEKLKELVNQHGTKAWMKIATILGNRSDVQCRYHFKQLGGVYDVNDDDDSPLPLHNSGFMAMSTDSLIQDQQMMNGNLRSAFSTTSSSSILKNFPEAKRIPLYNSNNRQFGSTPSVLLPTISKNDSFLTPLAPLTIRRPINSIKCFENNFTEKLACWGRVGCDSKSLEEFLQNFSQRI